MIMKHMLAAGALAALMVLEAGPAAAGSRIYWNIFPFLGQDDGYDGYSVYEYEDDEPVYRRKRWRNQRLYGDEYDDEGYAARRFDEEDEEPVVKRRRLDQAVPKPKRAPKEPAKRKPVKPETAAIAAPAKPKPKLMSCAKATKVVSGFGFESVKPADCEGQIYAFSAARSGKPYTVKLSAVTGELTEVAKK